MKYLILILFSVNAFAGVQASRAKVEEKKIPEYPKGVRKTSDYCFEFDKEQKFARCENGEIICYSMGPYGNCYPKPPAPPASPIPEKQKPVEHKAEAKK